MYTGCTGVCTRTNEHDNDFQIERNRDTAITTRGPTDNTTPTRPARIWTGTVAHYYANSRLHDGTARSTAQRWYHRRTKHLFSPPGIKIIILLYRRGRYRRRPREIHYVFIYLSRKLDKYTRALFIIIII